jgi:transcription-repair coupling factor (superfamily II helicase)
MDCGSSPSMTERVADNVAHFQNRSATSPWCAAPRSRWPAARPTCAQHAAPGAAAGRERWPPRKPARFPARQRRQCRRPSTRWPNSRPAREKVGIATAALTAGFAWLEDGLDLVTETELFAAGPTARRRKKQEQVSDVEALIKDLAELNVGDPVVHAAHGIGRYRGLDQPGPGPGHQIRTATPIAAGVPATWNTRTRLCSTCPCQQLQQISRYTGASAPTRRRCTSLGSAASGKRPGASAAEQVRDTAAELLNIYARRAAREGHPFRFSAQDYEAFAGDFGFRGNGRPEGRHPRRDPGHDLARARWTAWSAAMWASARPKWPCAPPSWPSPAASRWRLLAPTTLLAEQHYQTLVDRFSKWPVKVAEVSRFRSGKEINAALKGLADGSVDIVVGTHKLLSRIHPLQEPGPAHHRRGAPLWRAPQGSR